MTETPAASAERAAWRAWYADQYGYFPRVHTVTGHLTQPTAVEEASLSAFRAGRASIAPAPAPGSAIAKALNRPECDRLREWVWVGPVQRAAVQSFADALLAAPPVGVGVPVGWKLVPVEPTTEMLKAAEAEWLKHGTHEAQFPLAQGFDRGLPRCWQLELSRATHVYRAMLAATPQPPAKRKPVDDDPMPHGHQDIADRDPEPQQWPQPIPGAHVGESNFESWFAEYSPAGKGDKQRARDAYAAGMADRAPAAPAEPLDQPLPCDITVGHVTIRKGVALRVLVARMQVLYDMAMATPNPPAQRVPLTEEAVWASDEIMSINAAAALHMPTLMRLIGAIERAHGIGGPPPARTTLATSDSEGGEPV